MTMKKFLKVDEWNIIEEGFHADNLRASESIFSLGNGRFGQRGNFEESYSSDSLQGSYVAGITFLDRTRVGWWKNGYPRFFSRIPNTPDWSGIYVRLIDEELDLAHWDVESYERRLDMKAGISYRDFRVTSPKGNTLEVHVEHINSMDNQNLCLIKYSVTSVNYEGKISLVPYLNGDVKHESANFDEKMWNILRAETTNDYAYLWAQTRREDSQICCALTYRFFRNSKQISVSPIKIEKEKLTGFSAGADVKPGEKVTLIKYTAIVSSLQCDRQELVERAVNEAKAAREQGWESLTAAHKERWAKIWEETDVEIKGDPEAQQGIRFNIFQLNQSYQGDDERLNIGPKGFTGEKYGGNTQWNTELCCVPYFLLSTPREVCRKLLLYRYNQLPKAIENARKLGFTDGAALYPMVTIHGEECHNEWEITFEEIHRNNIIVYAIMQYARVTGNKEYIARYGLEVMIAICRFWSQRVSYSQERQKFVLLGVTGPNEYENNVNNNWYTNILAKWCLNYANEIADKVDADKTAELGLTSEERAKWHEIADNMYLPEDKELGIFVQHDTFLDKDLTPVKDLPQDQLPLNQHWSWDHILRSPYIKQADVLQGIYYFVERFTQEQKERNFDFYEPLTVHESSLSPSIHAILAADLHKEDKAFEMYSRTARLDLDNYNNDTNDGLHITSMTGSWLAIVQGFAGMRVIDDELQFAPFLPKEWTGYKFRINFRGRLLSISVSQEGTQIDLLKGDDLTIKLNGKDLKLTAK